MAQAAPPGASVGDTSTFTPGRSVRPTAPNPTSTVSSSATRAATLGFPTTGLPAAASFTTTGAYTYNFPRNCQFVDRIVLGGGGGGGGASFAFTPAQGGDAGAFAWDTLQRGVDFSYTETAITGTVGAGGSAGTGAGNGGNGGNSTATINGNTITGTGGTGRGGSGTQNGDAVTSGNANSGKDVSLNSQTYAGGATSTGTTANVPGAGGRGGNAFSNGNAGARGQVWFYAYQ